MVDVVVDILKLVLVIGLVIAWGSVLVPPVVRLFGGVGRGSDSVGSFRNKMSVLGAGTGFSVPTFDLTTRSIASAPARRPRQSAKKRRRDILVGLLAVNGVSLLAALLLGGMAVALFAVTALMLAGYVGLLWRIAQVANERQAKVAYFPQPEARHTAPVPLRRVGSVRS